MSMARTLIKVEGNEQKSIKERVWDSDQESSPARTYIDFGGSLLQKISCLCFKITLQFGSCFKASLKNLTCCVRLHGTTTMLALVAYSLKPVKLSAQQVPTYLFFCDRRT